MEEDGWNNLYSDGLLNSEWEVLIIDNIIKINGWTGLEEKKSFKNISSQI